jgi:hypothetical protein
MEFILGYLNLRGLLIAVVGALVVFVAVRYRSAPGQWYEARMVARDRGAAAFASDIAKDLDARESMKLKGLYRDVCAELAAAKARGIDVDALQRAADAAITLDAPGSRAFAFENLNRMRLAIPQPLDALRPAASTGDDPSDAPATPATAPAHRARARSR